jgi:preprotein translocase subunit SecG
MLISFFAGLLTVVLVLDCLFLLLLILIQLPKKEAGLGQAFGSSTTDALFGSGSGTALTKMTKYAAVIFFVLTFALTIINAQQSRAQRTGRLKESIEKAGKAAAQQAAPATAATPTNAPVKLTLPENPALKLTNAPVPLTAAATSAAPVLVATNAAATNPPPAPQPPK